MKRGAIFTEEHKRKLSESHKGKNLGNTRGFKKGQVPRNKGIPHSDEQKEKLKKARNLRTSSGMLGKHHTEETRKKISEIQKGRKASEERKKNISNAHKGKHTGSKSNFWKGGVCPTNMLIRRSQENKLRRCACFERDSFTCQKCGLSGGNLNAHHIHNFADYIELRFAIDNGITLCKICHNMYHKIYGKNNNTKEQLQEFLTSNY